MENNHFSKWAPEDFQFNRVQLTPETVDRAIQYFAANEQGCIDEVKDGRVTVNDEKTYIENCLKWKNKYMNKDFNVSLTFLQLAYFLQTGKSVPLLP